MNIDFFEHRFLVPSAASSSTTLAQPPRQLPVTAYGFNRRSVSIEFWLTVMEWVLVRRLISRLLFVQLQYVCEILVSLRRSKTVWRSVLRVFLLYHRPENKNSNTRNLYFFYHTYEFIEKRRRYLLICSISAISNFGKCKVLLPHLWSLPMLYPVWNPNPCSFTLEDHTYPVYLTAWPILVYHLTPITNSSYSSLSLPSLGPTFRLHAKLSSVFHQLTELSPIQSNHHCCRPEDLEFWQSLHSETSQLAVIERTTRKNSRCSLLALVLPTYTMDFEFLFNCTLMPPFRLWVSPKTLTQLLALEIPRRLVLACIHTAKIVQQRRLHRRNVCASQHST